MKIINITEEQREKLCAELARLTFDFRKDKSVECIYFAPYKGLDSIAGNALAVTLVRDGNIDNNLDEKIKSIIYLIKNTILFENLDVKSF